VALLAREETAALATGDLVIVPWTDPAPDLVDIFWRQPTTAKRP
jgi:translation initiation factor IF-1